MLAVRVDVTAHPFDAQPTAPDRKGPVGCWPQPRYRHPAPSVAALAVGLGQEAFTSLAWLQGSRGPLRSRFATVRVRPARPARPSSVRSGPPPRPDRAGGTASCPTAGSWSNGPRTPRRPPTTGCPACRPAPRSPSWSVWPRSAGASSTTTRTQARPGPEPLRRPVLARLAPPRHPRDRGPRVSDRTAPGPKSTWTALTLYQILDALQDILRCWTGTCTTCHQPLPSRSTTPRSRRT